MGASASVNCDGSDALVVLPIDTPVRSYVECVYIIQVLNECVGFVPGYAVI